MTVTIDKFGRVLIPKPLRDRLGLKPGTELALAVHDTGDGAPALEIRAAAETDDLEEGLVYIDGVLVHNGRPTDDMDTSRILKDIYHARALRHAGLDPDTR